MNVLIIPDKFKGSLTAEQVAQAIETGLRRRHGDIQCQTVAASDGGDGFLATILENLPEVEPIECATTDPLDRPIKATYLLDRKNKTAYVEMAKASGLELLQSHERDPLRASTRGTGRLIRDAIESGAKKVFVGIGGSATNDGGAGIAEEMGCRFCRADGASVVTRGGNLADISYMDASDCFLRTRDVEVFAINDVVNPLLGPTGASHVYGPQKGADPKTVERLDASLASFHECVKRDLGKDAADVPGAGAAGGTGFGLHVFLSAKFLSGVDFVLELAGVEQRVQSGGFDWIITGEGRIDDQTGYGKLVSGVAKVGNRYDVPVVAVCGLLQLEHRSVDDLGLRRVVQIHEPSRPIKYTIENASELVARVAETLIEDSTETS